VLRRCFKKTDYTFGSFAIRAIQRFQGHLESLLEALAEMGRTISLQSLPPSYCACSLSHAFEAQPARTVCVHPKVIDPTLRVSLEQH
jgi:hypothetical protein